MLLGSDAGLRCGEIIALEQTDVDLRRGVLHVRQSEWEGHLTLPKSGRGRKVVLTERLAAALAKNRHLRGPRVLWREESEGQGDPGAAREVDAAPAAPGGAQGDRKSSAIRLLDRGADRIADDLKDTENRGDTVETVSPSPKVPSNSM